MTAARRNAVVILQSALWCIRDAHAELIDEPGMQEARGHLLELEAATVAALSAVEIAPFQVTDR